MQDQVNWILVFAVLASISTSIYIIQEIVLHKAHSNEKLVKIIQLSPQVRFIE